MSDGRITGAAASRWLDHGRLIARPADRPGQAARIMTGAPLPAGADAVCMLEDCSDEDDGTVVVIDHPVAAGRGRAPRR